MEASFSTSDVHDHVVNLIKYVINNAPSKLPIKRTNLSSALGIHAKALSRVLDFAQNRLQEIYGLELVEVPNKKPTQYIVLSSFPATGIEEYTQKQRSQITLLFLILSHIFMRGGSTSEHDLFMFLRKFDIDDTSHSFFGSNIKKLITDTFVKQLYLKRDKIVEEGGQDDSFSYSWGERSILEVPKKELLAQIAELLGKPQECFAKQFIEVNMQPAADRNDIEMEES